MAVIHCSNDMEEQLVGDGKGGRRTCAMCYLCKDGHLLIIALMLTEKKLVNTFKHSNAGTQCTNGCT